MASESPNGHLSELLSNLTDKIADSLGAETECKSTEDMCAAIADLNNILKNENIEDIEIGSMDACSLYLSLKVEEFGLDLIETSRLLKS